MRFSDSEMELLRERAALAGLALAAWVGDAVLEVATSGCSTPVGLPDLLRLHADVLAVEGAGAGAGAEEIASLLARLDFAVDAVIAEIGRSRR